MTQPEHPWSEAQVAAFAKRFLKSSEYAERRAYPEHVRSALLTEFVMLIALGNDRSTTTIAEAFALRNAVSSWLAAHGKGTW